MGARAFRTLPFELPEARAGTERIERGIDPEPAGRENAGDAEQGLELIQRLARLAREQVDLRKLSLKVRTIESSGAAPKRRPPELPRARPPSPGAAARVRCTPGPTPWPARRR